MYSPKATSLSYSRSPIPELTSSKSSKRSSSDSRVS